VLGVSPDSAEWHAAFVRGHGFRHRLPSAEGHDLHERHGTRKEKRPPGKAGARLSTFLVDLEKAIGPAPREGPMLADAVREMLGALVRDGDRTRCRRAAYAGPILTISGGATRTSCRRFEVPIPRVTYSSASPHALRPESPSRFATPAGRNWPPWV
jgi:hypothetical protein